MSEHTKLKTPPQCVEHKNPLTGSMVSNAIQHGCQGLVTHPYAMQPCNHTPTQHHNISNKSVIDFLNPSSGVNMKHACFVTKYEYTFNSLCE
jgi:hypothetical protein